MEYAELHVSIDKKLKRWVSFIMSRAMVGKFVHLWGQKPICPNRADYGHAIQYDIGSFIKNKFLSLRNECLVQHYHVIMNATYSCHNLTLCRRSSNTSRRPCLLRCVSVIAHHPTPKMVLRSMIFGTPESGKILHNYIQNTHLQYILGTSEKCYL